MQAFFLLILAAAASMLVIPVAWRLAPVLGLIDQPDARKVHTKPVPRVGGWGIVVGCLVPLLLIHRLDHLLQSFFIGVVILFLFGVWDDARQLGHWPKFVGQIAATAIVVFYGQLYVTRLPFLDGSVLDPMAGQLFTMVAMIGVINAINHSDGLDGLAGGETMLSLVAIAFLGHLSHNELATDIALATIGGTLGFLRFNTHPAQVFMGDSGSQVLGFALSFLVVYLTQVANSAVSAALPLLLLGLPIADILAVFYQRIRGGMNWFKATRNHVHHRLLDLGFTHFESVVCIYSLQAGLVVSAVLLQYESDFEVTATYLLPVAALFTALTVAERRGWHVAKRGFALGRLRPFMLGLQQAPWLRKLTLAIIIVAVIVLMVVPVVWAETIPRDIGMMALLLAVPLAVILLLDFVWHLPFSSVIVRTITYVGAACATYVYVQYPGARMPVVVHAATALTVVLAIAVGLFVRFLAEQKFTTTPTDYLIALGLVVLATIDRVDVSAGGMILFVTHVIVLLYGCEVLAGNVRQWRFVLGAPTLLALAVLALRGLGALS
jgi:UDP-GlcNAc:undecaprenyl-phosphate GlcNAc-1-phosphate transferase